VFRVVLLTLSLLILSPLFCYSSEAVVVANGSNYNRNKHEIHVSLLLQGTETNEDDERTVHFPNHVFAQESRMNRYLSIFQSQALGITPALPVRSLYRLYSIMLV